jgi:diguanylate cyclase (GGDEF)-like protein/PAS domain S-box-containing protein
MTREKSALAFAAAATGVGIVLAHDAWPSQPLYVLALGVTAFAAALLGTIGPRRVATDVSPVPLSLAVEFVALLFFGPGAMTFVAAAAVTARAAIDSPDARGPRRLIRDVALAILATQAAGFTHVILGGARAGHLTWPWQGIPIAAAVAAYSFVRAGWSDLAGESPIGVFEWRERGARAIASIPGSVIAAGAAVAFVALLDRRLWEFVPVAAAPVFFACRAYLRHLTGDARDQPQQTAVDRRVRTAPPPPPIDPAPPAESWRGRAERFTLAAEGANDGLWEWDLTTGDLYTSARWRSMLGLQPLAVVARHDDWFERVHAEDRPALDESIEQHLDGRARHVQREVRLRHEDGTYRRFLCRGVAERDDAGHATRLAGSLTDLSDGSVVQERIRTAEFRDPLTGLCNRAVFVEGLGQRLQDFKQRRGSRFAVLYLDLDRFKVVNDSLGHLVGDELLTAVSRRLESCLRPGDSLARLGGDEFAILLNGLGDATQANAIAFRIQETLGAPFAIAGREVVTSASIGIAFSRPEYSNPEEIMRDADTAMYHAKDHGKARHELFDADMHARELDRLGFENDLRQAVKNNDFEVHYQPIVTLGTGMCAGFESLVRWSRNGQPVSPADFIPVAEELGLIESLGTWVLQEATRMFADWQRRYPAAGLEYITVNVSARQLTQQGFMYLVEQAVAQSGLKPSDLRLEITETALMDAPHLAAQMLRDLRNFGVKIYLDDFGTGYSSLSHLHKLPVDALKIDRSFVRSLTIDDRPAIVESILALARTLNTSVVAEGIETELQARELERLGCRLAQGYYFSPPVPVATVEEILRSGRPLGGAANQPVTSKPARAAAPASRVPALASVRAIRDRSPQIA